MVVYLSICCFVMGGNNIIYPNLPTCEFEMHAQNKKPKLERSAK